MKVKLKIPKNIILIIGFNILLIILVFLVQNSLPPQIPLFYGQPQGEDQLAPKLFLILPPLVAILVSVINFILSRLIKDQFLDKIFLATTITATILATIAVVKIIALIGNF